MNSLQHILGNIVWQNSALVVVDKNPCVLTIPARHGAADPRPVLGTWLQANLQARVWPVHRLDFEVSGLVVFALTARAHKLAGDAFERRLVRKRYEALTGAISTPPTPHTAYVWESRLVRGKKRSFEAPHGQTAITRAVCETVLERVEPERAAPFAAAGSVYAWSLYPETGKPHQLRVHLAKAGFPISGDVLYGGAPAGVPDAGIALRSLSLEFLDVEVQRELEVPTHLTVPSRWTSTS